MGMVMLILVLAAVSALVCLSFDREGDVWPLIREHAARMGRAVAGALVRSAQAASEGLLRADEHLRHFRRPEPVRVQSRPVAVAVDLRPSRLLAFIELLILAALIGAAVAAAVVGLAWAIAKGLT
jgi:hypothetical protein